MVKEGVEPVKNIEDIINKLKSPRVLWMMLPSDSTSDEMVKKLSTILQKNDIVIDASNSYFKDSVKRHTVLKKKGIHYCDVGFSGGPGGARHGACLMVGGTPKLFEYLYPLYQDLATVQGVRFFEGVGAGHFTKMIHNGIEYGMMQSLAEGFEVLKKSKYNLNLRHVAQIYNHGSVIESRLVDWLENAYRMHGDELSSISGAAGQGGGGAGKAPTKGEAELMLETSTALGVNTPVIADSVEARRKSRKAPSYQGKVINALRNQFGGHKA
jgi:6-phosphogluconate dehydrogenase